MKRLIFILEYLVCLFIVLDNRSVFSRMLDIGKYILPITAILIIMLVVLNFIFNRIEWKKMAKSLLVLCFFYLFFTIYLMINVFETRSYILTFMICFTFLFIYYATNKDKDVVKRMLIKYENIILIISLISLIFYVLASTFKLIESTNVIQTNWGDKSFYSYYNIYFETQIDYFNGIKIVRNSAIFIESPMFAVNLVIALLVEVFVKNEHKKSKMIILVISIITSTSLIGILAMILILLILFIRRKQISSISKFIKIISFPLIVTFIFMFSLYLLQNKVDNNDVTSSLSLRVDDYKAQFRAWRDRPILGNGFANDEAIEQYMEKSRFDVIGKTGQANSIGKILAHGGIYIFIFYMIPVIVGIYYGRKNKKLFFFVVILFALYFGIVIPYTVLTMNFLAIGYAMIINKEIIEDENSADI